MSDHDKNNDGRLLERLSGLDAPAPPPLDPGLEARLLEKLGRRRFSLRFPWDWILLLLLLAVLAWDVVRIISYLLE